MALSVKDMRILVQLYERGYVPNSGRVADLGAQTLSTELLADTQEFLELAKARGLADGPPTPCQDARELWLWLGLRPTVFDIDGTPGVIPLDLNYDRVPLLMRRRFAVVTNYGTSEHVANQFNVFKVMHDLTRRWGVMIHHVPAQGFPNHGLVNYNPKFFWMLARSNRYKVLFHDFSVGEASPFPANLISEIEQYEPSIAARTERFRMTDCSVTIAFQKMHAGPFLPPLDVGAMMGSGDLERRYWTVFGDTPFIRARDRAYDFASDRMQSLFDWVDLCRQPLVACKDWKRQISARYPAFRPLYHSVRRLLGREPR